MAPGPRVSVVIATYNRAAFLEEALKSAFAQTLRPFEVIVADDGSTDGTHDLLAGYGRRVQPVFLSHAGYPSPVKNAGIGAAKGEMIALLDSDDIWLPDKLQRQVALLEQNRRFGFVYGNAVFFDVEGTTSAPALSAHQLRSGYILRDLVHDMFIIPSTLIMRRSILDRAGLFDESIRASECYPFALRLAYVAEAGCIADPVALIRRHPGQASLMRGAENFAGAIMGLERFVDTHALPYSLSFEARRTLARLHTHLARVYCGEGDWRTARRHVAGALLCYPLHRPAWRWAVLSLTKRRR